MASVFTQKSRIIDKVLEDARRATAHGGQLMVDALAEEFGCWERPRRYPLLDPRKDQSRGFSPRLSWRSGCLVFAAAGQV